MTFNPENTMTEADFKRPLLEASELKLARDLHGEPDFAVDGLSSSVLGWLAGFFGSRR